MKTVLFLAALFLFCAVVRADLEWEKKELEFHPAITDTEVKAEFRFANAGGKPVTIESVKSDCGCATAVSEKRTYRPGEKGRISVVFTPGNRTGIQNKKIRVAIQGEKGPVILSMVTHIPDLIKITPRFVFWRTGDAPEPKTIAIEVARDTPVRVGKVTSSDPSVSVAVETVKEGRSYKVVVTPGQTGTPVSALLSIDMEVAPNVHQLFSAYAHVKLSDSQRPKVWVYKAGEAEPAAAKKDAGAR